MFFIKFDFSLRILVSAMYLMFLPYSLQPNISCRPWRTLNVALCLMHLNPLIPRLWHPFYLAKEPFGNKWSTKLNTSLMGQWGNIKPNWWLKATISKDLTTQRSLLSWQKWPSFTPFLTLQQLKDGIFISLDEWGDQCLQTQKKSYMVSNKHQENSMSNSPLLLFMQDTNNLRRTIHCSSNPTYTVLPLYSYM